jgi:hypothetical protein
MEKEDALVLSILADASSEPDAKVRITAPAATYSALRQKYEEAENQLKDYKFDICAYGERHAQKKLTWSSKDGLLVHDVGLSGDRPHWSQVHDTTLLSTLSLIPSLLDNAHQYAVKTGAKNLKAAADAVLSGLDVPLVPAPKPISRIITVEEDNPLTNPTVEDDIEDDDYLEEEEEEEDGEDLDDASLQEIIGANELPEMTTDVADLDALLPPARTAPEEPPTKRGRKKKG